MEGGAVKETEAGAEETAPSGAAGEGADPEKMVPAPPPLISAACGCFSFRHGSVQPVQNVRTASSDQAAGATYIHTSIIYINIGSYIWCYIIHHSI